MQYFWTLISAVLHLFVKTSPFLINVHFIATEILDCFCFWIFAIRLKNFEMCQFQLFQYGRSGQVWSLTVPELEADVSSCSTENGRLVFFSAKPIGEFLLPQINHYFLLRKLKVPLSFWVQVWVLQWALCAFGMVITGVMLMNSVRWKSLNLSMDFWERSSTFYSIHS